MDFGKTGKPKVSQRVPWEESAQQDGSFAAVGQPHVHPQGRV